MIWVMLGGALGSACRYGLSLLFPAGNAVFPFVTLSINLVACFVLGFLVGWAGKQGSAPEMRQALEVGFCGGFSTFSTFSKETMGLVDQGLWGCALAYILASNLGGLVAFYGGGRCV